jgi:hypothetical protein
MRIDSHNEQYDNSAIRNKRNKRFVEQFEEECKTTQKMPEFTAFSQPANPKGPEVQKGLTSTTCGIQRRPQTNSGRFLRGSMFAIGLKGNSPALQHLPTPC